MNETLKEELKIDAHIHSSLQKKMINTHTFETGKHSVVYCEKFGQHQTS